MTPATLALTALLALGARAQEPRGVSPERQTILAEMWQRRIITADARSWSAEDMVLLERMRRAERAGAVDFLRERFHGLKGWVAVYRPIGEARPRYRLTKDGFDKYLFARTQDALSYFQGKDIEYKWAFQMTDLDGKPLFDPNGLLTSAGEDLYAEIVAGRPARWRQASGEIGSSKPMRPAPGEAHRSIAAPPLPSQAAPAAAMPAGEDAE